ncbi:MAG: LOG family protein [Planctomycetota bacterium]
MGNRYNTGIDILDETIDGLIALSGGSPHSDLIKEIVVTAIKLVQDGAGRGDLKIINSALKELRYAFKIFRPYATQQKVTMFGSARTKEGDPAYIAAREFARKIAERDWMVITGAGPGIMQAGIEGAGKEHAFGVSIRLPFEASAIEFFEDDPKLINFKYFFTRKLCFAKEAEAIVLLPGGFGTLDEAYETLTLVQTGKSPIIPFVMLDTPGSEYWGPWQQFIDEVLIPKGLITAEDKHLYLHTDNVDAAVEEVVGFYRNYHSMRYVRDLAVIRVKHPISAAMVKHANEQFADILEDGEWVAGGPMPEEANEEGIADLPRLIGKFDRRQYSRFRLLINLINRHTPA